MSRCRWDLEPQSRFRGSGRPTGTHLSAFAGPPLIWTTLGKSKFHSFPLYSVYCMFTYSTPSRPEVTLSVIFGKIHTLGKSKFHSLPMYIQRILYALSLWSYIACQWYLEKYGWQDTDKRTFFSDYWSASEYHNHDALWFSHSPFHFTFFMMRKQKPK